MASGAKATLTLGCFQNNELVSSTTMQTAQLDPQAQALLNQMSAMSAQAPTPASPLSPEQELAVARLGYRAAIPLAGSPEAVYKVEDRYLTGPGAVLPAMRKQRSSHILNLSSVGGFVSFGSTGIYCATKFAALGTF